MGDHFTSQKWVGAFPSNRGLETGDNQNQPAPKNCHKYLISYKVTNTCIEGGTGKDAEWVNNRKTLGEAHYRGSKQPVQRPGWSQGFCCLPPKESDTKDCCSLAAKSCWHSLPGFESWLGSLWSVWHEASDRNSVPLFSSLRKRQNNRIGHMVVSIKGIKMRKGTGLLPTAWSTLKKRSSF